MLPILFALILVVGLFTQCSNASEPRIEHLPVYDLEAGFRVSMENGDIWLCLITSEGYGFTKQVKRDEVALTCTLVGALGIAWQFCIGGPARLGCVPPETKIFDQVAAPRPKPDIEIGLGMRYIPGVDQE